MSKIRFFPFLLAASWVVLLGCNRGPELADVEGTIKFKGKPLDNLSVEFWPENNGPRSVGLTDAQGRYTLTMDDGKRKGAVLGNHRIMVRDASVIGKEFYGREAETKDLSQGRKSRIPEHYGLPERTPLTKEVKSGKTVIDLDL